MNKQKVMYSALTVCAVLSVPLIVTGQASQAQVDRPPLISEESWVPLSAGFGLVLTSETIRADSIKNLINANPASGYFMVKINGAWRRVSIEQPARAMNVR